jgi:hypothetical protein
VKSLTWNRFRVDEIWIDLFNKKSSKIQYANRIAHRSNSKNVRVLRANIERSNEQQVEMRIARTSSSRKNDHANDDFIASHNVHMKSMFRTCSFDLFVNCQINNYLRQLCLIRVARTIKQRQRNDDSIYENIKNRFAYRFWKFLSHLFENIEKRNARSIYSFSFVSFASYNSKSIE